MFSKIVILTVFLVGVNCRYLIVDTEAAQYLVDENDLEDLFSEQVDYVEPMYLSRHTRQAEGGTVKTTLIGNDKNVLSAVSGLERAKDGQLKAAVAGLALDNVNGHGLSVTGTHIPNVSNELKAAGNLNLLDKDNHALSANAFASRTFPINPTKVQPSFDTVGGGVDYSYKDKLGLSASGIHNTNDGTELKGSGKVNLFNNANHDLSANAFATGNFPKNNEKSSFSTGGGIDYLYKNKLGLSASGTHDSNFGSELTGAGKVNLFHNDNHDLSANAFATRTFPNNPAIPNFNKMGGGMDYMFKDKIGASLGVGHNDLLHQTDYSAMGRLNLYRDPTTSLDFSAGASRSLSPYISHSSWNPSADFTFRKYF